MVLRKVHALYRMQAFEESKTFEWSHEEEGGMGVPWPLLYEFFLQHPLPGHTPARWTPRSISLQICSEWGVCPIFDECSHDATEATSSCKVR